MSGASNKEFRSYYTHATDSCCRADAYAKYNLYAPNPFDARVLKSAKNAWCSNELILCDKDLRCAARVQPLDIALDKAVSKNIRQY